MVVGHGMTSFRRALSDIAVKPGTAGCVVLSGQLKTPYTGRLIKFMRGPQSSAVQIEHVVALGDSWQKGPATHRSRNGQTWPTTRWSC